MKYFSSGKLLRRLSPFLILTLAVLACNFGKQLQDSPADTEAVETAMPTSGPPETSAATLEPEASGTPLPGGTPSGEASAPRVDEKPPQSQAAEIRQLDRREELTRLSALTGFQVVDRNGALLGTVSDFIINTCETYLIYFILDPVEALGYAPGSRLVIPYEVVTINSGALDAQSRAILLNLTLDQLTGAPAFPEAFDLIPTDWESNVRLFFSQMIRLSNLTTECRVAAPGTDSAGGTVVVHKIAYATDLLGAGLYDGLQNMLGTVEEAVLSPESGKLSFFVIRLPDGGGWVLVPLRVVNIPKLALEPGNEISLVLLTENDVLLNAPRIDTLEDAGLDEVQNSARQYWNR